MDGTQPCKDLVFRQASPTDLWVAQAAYRQILDHLGATVDYPHWHSEGRPSTAEVEAWVGQGELYLALDAHDKVAGVVALNHDAPDTYAQADWAVDATPAQVLVVHALGVTPDFQGRGVARLIVDASLDVARAKGCRAVRLDTYVENLPARSLYSTHGFTDLGVHTLRYEGADIDQFHLFERVL